MDRVFRPRESRGRKKTKTLRAREGIPRLRSSAAELLEPPGWTALPALAVRIWWHVLGGPRFKSATCDARSGVRLAAAEHLRGFGRQSRPGRCGADDDNFHPYGRGRTCPFVSNLMHYPAGAFFLYIDLQCRALTHRGATRVSNCPCLA